MFPTYQGYAVACRACRILKPVSIALGQIKPYLFVKKKKGWQGVPSLEVVLTDRGCSTSATLRRVRCCTNQAWRTESWLCYHNTWPHLGIEGDQVVQARLLGFALGRCRRTRMAVASGLMGCRDPRECGPLRSPPCPLLPLQALYFIPFQWGREESWVLTLLP